MSDRAELLESLGDPDPVVRRRAARALDHLPLDGPTIEALVSLILRENVPAVRGAAVHVLACEGCKPEACTTEHDLVGLMIDLLANDVSAEVRRQTIDGLRGHDHEPRVQAALTAALRDRSEKVRWKAAYRLPFEERQAYRP